MRPLILLLSLVLFTPAALAQFPPTDPPTKPTSQPTKSTPPPVGAPEFTAWRIERGHGKDKWDEHQIFQCDLTTTFGDDLMFAGTFTYDHRNNRVRLESSEEGGPLLVYDGSKAWYTSEEDVAPPARLQLLAWPSLLLAPFKLHDNGAKLETYEPANLVDRALSPIRMTFEEGVRDAPDDWFVLYVDPQTGRLSQMAYYLSSGRADEVAQPPHAVLYDRYMLVAGGVTLATKLSFHNWSEEQGAHGDAIGTVTIGSPRFVGSDDELFKRPEGAKESPPPGDD